jgi:hypothetical protein
VCRTRPKVQHSPLRGACGLYQTLPGTLVRSHTLNPCAALLALIKNITRRQLMVEPYGSPTRTCLGSVACGWGTNDLNNCQPNVTMTRCCSQHLNKSGASLGIRTRLRPVVMLQKSVCIAPESWGLFVFPVAARLEENRNQPAPYSAVLEFPA